MSSTHDALVVPVTILPEVDYLLTQRFRIRAELTMLRSLTQDGFHLESLTDSDFQRSVELIP